MPKTKQEIKDYLEEQEEVYNKLSAICDQEMFGFQNTEEGDRFFSPSSGISTLNRIPSRKKIASMYFLSKGHTIDDLFSEDQAMVQEKRRVGEEFKALFQNKDMEELKAAWLDMHEEWRKICVISEDLSNDEYLAQNYVQLYLMHSEMDLKQSVQGNRDLNNAIFAAWGETKKERMDSIQQQLFDVYDAAMKRVNFILSEDSPYMDPSKEMDDVTLFQQAAAKQMLCANTANGKMAAGAEGEMLYLLTYKQGIQLKESMDQLDDESKRVCKEKLKADALSELPVENLIQYKYEEQREENGEVLRGSQGQILYDRKVEFTDDFKNQMRDCGSKVQRIEDMMERLKTADHIFHRNSSQFKEVLRSLEEVSQLSAKMAVAESRQEIEAAYTRLGTACQEYLADKTVENRYTSLGKSRVQIISELLSYQQEDLEALGRSDLDPVNQEPVHQQTEQNAVRRTSFSELNPPSGQTGRQRENQRVNTPNKAKEHTVSGRRK